MSLHNTTLPPFILADIFRHSLIEQPVEDNIREKATKSELVISPIPYLGKNLKNFTIIVYYPGQDYMPAEVFDFLISVLKACRHNADDVAILNYASGEPKLTDIQSQLHPELIMLFGTTPLYAQLIPGMEEFTITNVEDMKVISITELDKFIDNTAESKTLKGKLWTVLKQLFNL